MADIFPESSIRMRRSPFFRIPKISIGFLLDILAIGAVVAVGCFLIGYYLRYEFLETDYPDWMYHAFRVRDISDYGVASWDHIWGNGGNIWQAYQYVQHLVVLGVSSFFGMSITHSMLVISVVTFIALRLVLYVMFRLLGINRLLSVFSSLASYGFSQQWISLKDFSLCAGLIVVPFYIFLWIRALENRGDSRLTFVAAAFAGASWSIHPVIGYSLSGMLLWLLLTNHFGGSPKVLMGVLLVFLLSSLPFSMSYLLSGYSIINPVFLTSYYSDTLLVSDGYLGLNLLYFVLVGASWLILIVKSGTSPRWAKVLLFYCSAYLLFIYFGRQGYYPEFVNKFQFSRAIPFLAIALSFCFAAFLQSAFGSIQSRMVSILLLIVMSTSVVHSIETASLYTARPVSSMSDPVAEYFRDKDVPEGSIYFKDFVNSSYFGKRRLRFVNSYNQHLLLNPYPMRFDALMKTDVSYTGVTDRQIRMINDYSIVLGVQYLFIPKYSPLADALSSGNGSSESIFERVDEVRDNVSGTFAVLRRRDPIFNAYYFDSSEAKDILRFEDIPKPTLQSSSFQPWDNEISRIAALIRNGTLKPIPVSFLWPDRLKIDLSSLQSSLNIGVFVNQSYDGGWSPVGSSAIRVVPTSSRFMYIASSDSSAGKYVLLQHSWPWWHWTVQCSGVALLLLSVIWASPIGKLSRRGMGARTRTESSSFPSEIKGI